MIVGRIILDDGTSRQITVTTHSYFIIYRSWKNKRRKRRVVKKKVKPLTVAMIRMIQASNWVYTQDGEVSNRTKPIERKTTNLGPPNHETVFCRLQYVLFAARNARPSAAVASWRRKISAISSLLSMTLAANGEWATKTLLKALLWTACCMAGSEPDEPITIEQSQILVLYCCSFRWKKIQGLF